ncbi:DUF1572 family protein [Pedobacter sp. Du54]|uniref:DUF1572 family protein n=1 Tax=Pedobacter anseongensis TaxID=3133439 RepID=UPI00309A5688
MESLKALFKRDLNKLKIEIESYTSEKNIWIVDKKISNSGGNLCLHLIGNLNAYVGVGLAKTGYIRNREREFANKNVERAVLVKQIEDTITMVENGLNGLTESKMSTDFPIEIWDKPTEMGYTLIHLLSHLNYHLGQINYHRRLLDK